MSANIFTLSKIENGDNYNNNNNLKINLDDLFEKKKQHDIDELKLFNKLLNQIHTKIKLTSRQKINEQYLWFVVPQFILGYTKYKQAPCIVYLIDKLKTNNFLVNYYHPSLLYIFWGHWYPKYIRDEIKTKTGIQVNEYGEKIDEEDDVGENKVGYNPYEKNKEKRQENYNEILLNQNHKQDSKSSTSKKNEPNKYTNINSYNPTGNLTYNKILSMTQDDQDQYQN
jgi:hypothetical protein